MISFVTKFISVAFAGLVLMATAASAGSLHRAGDVRVVNGGHAHVVHYRVADRGHRYHHRHHRHVHDGVVVDAPFTRVETRGYRRVAVDAPFTGVRVHRRGVWVRAPFVNLYVPR